MTNKIIAAFARRGKTTLAQKYPDTFVDFICMPYKYIIDNDTVEKEACKANPDYEMNYDWPENYVEAIKKYSDKTKILIILSDLRVLRYLKQDKIKYYICYPEKKAKREYKKRFIKRGNTDYFIDIFIGGWDDFIRSFENDKYGEHIVLKKKEYLEDVIMHIMEKLR